MVLKAGDLREKITFYEPIRVKGVSLDYTTTYTEVLSTFAKVDEIRSLPNADNGQEDIRQFLKVLIRYRPDLSILNGYKAEWRGFTFIVNNIKVDPLRTSIEIMIVSEIETSER